MNNENQIEYRDIPGFRGYRVGNDGSLWSCHVHGNEPGQCMGEGGGSHIGDFWRQLSTPPDKDGYKKAVVSSDGKVRHTRVHILVLESFVGPKPDGCECRHLDGDRTNNKLSNICWGTPKENADDRTRQSRRVYGSKIRSKILTLEDVYNIRERYKNGESQQSIAESLGIGQSTVSRMILKKNKWCSK